MKATVVQDEKQSVPEQRKQMAGQKLVFDVPTEFAPLPSKGKLYGAESNLHNKEEIEISVMTAKEEDILTSLPLIRKGLATRKLLESVITDLSINVNDLLRGDMEALLITSRITGYGSEYKVKVKCPSCDESFEAIFNLSGLPIRTLEIEPVEEYRNLFETVLPVTKKTVFWKFITGEEEYAVMQLQKKRKAVVKSDIDNLITNKLISSIVAIDGVEDKGQISAFVRKMPARDSMYLRNLITNNEPKILMEDTVMCNECGEESTIDIPMTEQFFWPSA